MWRSISSDMPLQRPVKVAQKSAVSEDSNKEQTKKMNPFAKPRKVSLLMREAYRSGAADNVPYYGVRKNGVWFPQDDSGDGMCKCDVLYVTIAVL